MKVVLGMIARRLGLGFITLFVVTLMIFTSVELLPGDLAQTVLGQSATEETLRAFRDQLGLNKPPITRYLNWLHGAVQGDFGNSLANDRPVAQIIGRRLQNTFFLAAVAASIAVPLALGLGLLAALYRNSGLDRAINVGSLAAISFPEFFVAYILILAFAIKCRWFPVISMVDSATDFADRLYQTFLPAMTLTLVVTAHMMRMTRVAIINLLSLPFIEMARLKGASPGRIILRHALPNAVAPIANIVALNLGYLITGVVVVEVVFVYPGLGQLLVDSVSKRDIPVVQASCLIFAAAYILLNLTADVLSILSSPRLLYRR
jgi:peptide/nickel transport system permease protein